MIAVGLILLGLVGALVMVLTTVATNTRDAVLDEQEQYDLTSSSVVQGIFNIASVRYADTSNASCTLATEYLRPAILTLTMKAYEIPESCSIFANNVLLPGQTMRQKELAPDCTIACNFKEFNRQFSIGLFDYRDSHTIEVCCDSICIRRQLKSLC